MRSAVIFSVALLSGCGETLMDEPIQVPSVSEQAEAAPARPVPPPGALWRQDVNETVEEGLGYFLQRVAVEPEVTSGKFQGFRIVELRPAEFWTGVDLKPGDVVTGVNGMSIERDIDAYQAFQGLLSAPSLRVSFVRGGVKRELVYSIVDRDAKASSKPAAAPAAAPVSPKAPTGKQSGTG